MERQLDKSKLSVAFRDQSLCARSGTCVGVCPENAIEIGPDLYPIIPDVSKCTECGLCEKVCPGGALDYGHLAKDSFGLAEDPDEFDGFVQKTYVAQAQDEKIRKGGAGGGVITALLWDLLKHGDVDGCVVTRMKPEKPWIGEPFIATNYDQLVSSQGSRYSIIPLNSILKKIRESEGSFAIAALPCHVHGIRKAYRDMPELQEKISAIVGLFCGGGLEPHFVTELLQTKGIDAKNVKDFQFRGGEWPGKMRAILKDDSIINTHYSNYKDGAYNYATALYMPTRCTTCLDGSGEFSDVSVSDAWTRDSKGNYMYKEHSRILVRTDRGVALVKKAMERESITAHDVGRDAAYKTHKLQTKRKGLNARLRVDRWSRRGIPVPEYDRIVPTATKKEKVTELAISSLLRLGRNRWFRYPVIKFLTSGAAIPLIHLRLFIKKRKYSKRR